MKKLILITLAVLPLTVNAIDVSGLQHIEGFNNKVVVVEKEKIDSAAIKEALLKAFNKKDDYEQRIIAAVLNRK
jgi:hypothetical protein